METNVKKRGWVKNAIIIFLLILLVLTLFSNTILNHSLPEVSAQYVGSGSITTRVRGSGTIEAVETYDVKATQSRTVQSVPVRVGDQVEVGDVLMYLTGDASAEIETARTELETLETAYERALLTATSSDYARENRDIENARRDLQEAQAARDKLKPDSQAVAAADVAVTNAQNGVDAVKQAQTALKARIKEAEAAVSDYEKEISAYQKEINAHQKEVNAAQKELDAAQKELDAAQKELDTAQQEADAALVARDNAKAQLEALGGKNSGSIGSDAGVVAAQAQVDAAQEALNAAKDDLTAKELIYGADYEIFHATAEAERGETSLSAYMKYLAEIYSQNPPADPDTRTEEQKAHYAQYEAYTVITRYQQAVADAQQALESAKAAYVSAQASYYETYEPGNIDEWNKRNTALTAAEETLTQKQYTLQQKKRAWDEKSALKDQAATKVDALNETKADMEEKLKEMREETLADKNAVVTDLQEQLTASAEELADAEAALQEAKAARDELDTQAESYKAAEQNVRSLQKNLEDQLFALSEQQKTDSSAQALQTFELNEQRKQIEKKRAELQALQEEGMGQTIVAQTAGTVKSISVSAGATTTPDSVLVSIEVTDRGYSLSFPVSLEQSRRVRVGDAAELVDYWWGPEITATLSSIRPDPANPQQSRLLVFDITGEEVSVGTQLTLSIGQRNTNYDLVVPSSAIRSDTNGSFVLVVEAKPSPLGNRYIATRADVTVITSDDSNSAVSGSLSNSDFVITTSTRPVEPGMQVRMAD